MKESFLAFIDWKILKKNAFICVQPLIKKKGKARPLLII